MRKCVLGISLVLVICLVLIGKKEYVSASNNKNIPNEIIDGTDYSRIVSYPDFSQSGFSGARKVSYQDIINDDNNIAKYYGENFVKNAPDRATWKELTNPSLFYYYAQENNYTCGPACVKMALKYLTGTTYSETAISIGCNTTSTNGTYLSDMCTYINGEQNSNSYVTRYNVSKTTMTDNLYDGIVLCDAPPVIGIQESTTLGWPFNLNAHFVTVYAAKSDKSVVMIADPWAGYISMASSYKWYSKSMDDVYTGYISCGCGYMY